MRPMDEQVRHIARMLKEMPEVQPPADFVESVMRAIKARRLPWWRRCGEWCRSPQTLRVTPIRVAPWTATGGLVCLLAVLALTYQNSAVRRSLDTASGETPITFRVEAPGAHAVSVIGSFNQWQGRGYEMHRDATAPVWTMTLWLPPGRHEYAFLVDGKEVLTDPQALLYQEDGFGSRNAVLIVGQYDDQSV